MSGAAEVGDVLGQGTAGAALCSQPNLDHGLHGYFEGSKDEVYYGSVRCEYFAYQDDVGKPRDRVMEAQAGNINMASLFQEKGLQAHPDKTGFIVFGDKQFKRRTEEDLKLNPLHLGDFKMKRKTSDKYLGQILHEDGVRASVKATIEERTGKKGSDFLNQLDH